MLNNKRETNVSAAEVTHSDDDLFDDPPLKIPREISMDGISVSNSIQQYPNIFYLN